MDAENDWSGVLRDAAAAAAEVPTGETDIDERFSLWN